MKKSFMKKLTAILLMLTLVSGIAACGKGGDKTSTDSKGTGTKTEDKVTEDKGTTTDNSGNAEEGPTYPVKTDKKLTVWSNIMTPNKAYTSYTESPWHTGLAELTGIEVEWIFPTAGSNSGEAFNLMLASEELPDIIIYNLVKDADQYMDDGILRDLTDLIPEHAPNYWNFLQENTHYQRSMKADSGRYYGFGAFREESWGAVFTGPVVRMDWLEECGLEVPTTIEEWDNVIRTFNEKYDAKLSFSIKNRMNPGLAGTYGTAGSFASSTDELFYLDDNGKIQFSMANTGWRDYMAQLNTWYMDGLIDPDTLTLDDAGMRTKALNEKVGISITSMGQMTNWLADAKAQGTNAQWAGIPYPVVNPGDTVFKIQMEDTARPNIGAITSSCDEDKVEIALKWLDYFYSEEGFLYVNYGTEGESYTMVDGVPTFTDLILKAPEGVSEALEKYTASQYTSLGVQATGHVRQKNDPVSVAAVDTWLQNQESEKHFVPTGVTRTTAESDETSVIMTSLRTYIQEMSLKFVTGEESIDNFDKFLEELDRMGVQRLLEIQQGAYDRFLNR